MNEAWPAILSVPIIEENKMEFYNVRTAFHLSGEVQFGSELNISY